MQTSIAVGEREQQDSNSLIDYFKGQFSILNDVSYPTHLLISHIL